MIQELVWLGDIPVATIRTDQGGSGVGVFYIHTDHLNSPTKITRPTDNQVIWRWDHDPYGNGVPNEDPDGNNLILSMNLRFPGQYFDQETGLYYNYYRDYDPTTGRYIESDPLGLVHSLNTYAYLDAEPISNLDPYGLGPNFRWYGNWGGPGWAAGRWVAEADLTDADMQVPALDRRDACYKGHDLCIRKASNTQCVNGGGIRSCDHKLASCLRQIPPWNPSFWYLLNSFEESIYFDTLIPYIVH